MPEHRLEEEGKLSRGLDQRLQCEQGLALSLECELAFEPQTRQSLGLEVAFESPSADVLSGERGAFMLVGHGRILAHLSAGSSRFGGLSAASSVATRSPRGDQDAGHGRADRDPGQRVLCTQRARRYGGSRCGASGISGNVTRTPVRIKDHRKVGTKLARFGRRSKPTVQAPAQRSSVFSPRLNPTFPVVPRLQYRPALLAAFASSHSVPVGTFSSHPLLERVSSVRPGGGFLPFGRAVNQKDRHRRASLCGESAPAPNETKGSVAHETDQANYSSGGTCDARV
jgi:hypothetical protein